MKTVMKFLSLLLCFELVLGPVQGSLFMSSDAYAQDCPTGQTFNSSVNRCLTSYEAIKIDEATLSCGDNKECLENNAKDAAAPTTENPFGKRGGTTGTAVAGAVAIGIPLLIVTTVLVNKSKAKKADASYQCKPASLMLMYAAAAALGVGEIYGFFNHKAKLDKIQKEWDATVVHKKDSSDDKKRTEATEAQSQAFEYLAQNEDQVAKTAKTKKGFYLAATGLFAAGAVMAVVEQIKLKKAQLDITTNGPAKILAGKTSNPRNPAMEAEGRRLMDEGKITVNKLTCNSGNDESTDEGKALKEQSEKDEKLRQQIKKPNDNASLDLGELSYISRDDLKRVAAYNLSTANDAEQLMQLMNEMEAIEFENYSKVSYLEDDLAQDLKKIPLLSEISKNIANAIIPSAQAQDPGCAAADAASAVEEAAAAAASAAAPEKKNIMGTAMMAMPLALGLYQILGGVKSKGGTPLPKVEKEQITHKTTGWLNKAIGTPYSRAAINGVLGGWMGIMAGHMNKQQKLAQARAVKLREMKEEFASANGIRFCTEEDRQNSCKPKCFCFTADNKINPARSNQPACANALSKLAYDPFGTDSNDKVCLDQNSNVDPACACRVKRNCMKITSGLSMKGFNPGTFKMISTGVGPAQDLMNGNIGGGDIADSAGINAARIQKAADDMLAKMDPSAAKSKDSYAAGLEKGLIASSAGLSMGGSGNSSPLPSSPAAAAAALDKELKENKETEITTAGGGFKSAAGYDSKDDMPEFGLNMDQAASQELEIAEVMGQNLDMGNSDINTGSKTNLFEVLSNRYKRSGMRRLFDENNPSPVDAPAKKEIVE